MNTQIPISEEQASRILKLLESEIAAHHNWIASAVECGDKTYGQSEQSGLEYAQNLVPKLRDLQKDAGHLRSYLYSNKF